jgi:hypothetical protein
MFKGAVYPFYCSVMKNLLLLVFVCALPFCGLCQQVAPRLSSDFYKKVEKTKTSRVQEDRVYVCFSKSAYAYHAYICRGFKKCKAGRSEVSVAEARKMGYVPCKICY